MSTGDKVGSICWASVRLTPYKAKVLITSGACGGRWRPGFTWQILAGPITPALMTTAYAQPHPRFSVLSNSSLSSAELLSPAGTTSRFSLSSAPSINTALATPKPTGARPNIYDRNLNKTLKAEVSASAFAFLFSEMVQYTQKRVSGINDLERRYSGPSGLLEQD